MYGISVYYIKPTHHYNCLKTNLRLQLKSLWRFDLLLEFIRWLNKKDSIKKREKLLANTMTHKPWNYFERNVSFAVRDKYHQTLGFVYVRINIFSSIDYRKRLFYNGLELAYKYPCACVALSFGIIFASRIRNNELTNVSTQMRRDGCYT